MVAHVHQARNHVARQHVPWIVYLQTLDYGQPAPQQRVGQQVQEPKQLSPILQMAVPLVALLQSRVARRHVPWIACFQTGRPAPQQRVEQQVQKPKQYLRSLRMAVPLVALLQSRVVRRHVP